MITQGRKCWAPQFLQAVGIDRFGNYETLTFILLDSTRSIPAQVALATRLPLSPGPGGDHNPEHLV